MSRLNGSWSVCVGVMLIALTAGCAKPRPAEGLRPIPLVLDNERLTREATSLQPFFQWEPFPRSTDWKADTTETLGRVQNVTYDLRIWRAEGLMPGPCLPRGACFYPAELVYARAGLPSPFHTVESSLAPYTPYLWTVRARFQLDGHPRVTEWSALTATDKQRNFPKPRDGVLPSLGYYSVIIKTPAE
jgi:hypothetical protein